MLDPRRLLVLATVARAGSMTAAAAALAYTPSAISQSIARSARGRDTALVRRGPRGVALTPAGELLARHAAALRERLDLAAEELDEHVGLRAGRLRLAAFPTPPQCSMPPGDRGLSRAPPGVGSASPTPSPTEAAGDFVTADIDLAVVFEIDFERVLDPAGISSCSRCAATSCSWRPPGHALAGADAVPLARLADETWVASADATCHRLLQHRARGAGFAPRVAFASDDYGAVGTARAVAGVGVAAVPQLAAAAVGGEVALPAARPAAAALSVALPPDPSAAATRCWRAAQGRSGSIHFDRAGGASA